MQRGPRVKPGSHDPHAYEAMASHIPLHSLLLLAACGCRQAPAPHLILLTLDTTRADHLGCYGHAQARTPNIDRFAARGLLFERAYTTIPLTTPAHASILTGLTPPRHGIRSNGDAILPEEIPTLAEHLKAQGYRTAASVSAFVTTRVWNLDQGFDTYLDNVQMPDGRTNGRWAEERPANEVVDDAISWLQATDSAPFFLWAHFYDPHLPYRPPEPWASSFPGAPYDGEIAFVDEQIGRLRKAIESLETNRGTAWILVGDHGEALDDLHGERAHGLFLFEETTRVPFIVVPAASQEASRSKLTVSIVDLMPTALGLLGMKAPPDLDGVDLSPILSGRSVVRPPVYMESLSVAQRFGYHPELAAVDQVHKLMDTPSPRLYDLDRDPSELHNLVSELPEEQARLSIACRAAFSREPDVRPEAPTLEVQSQLAALGYVEPSFSANSLVFANIDAKDRVETIKGLERAHLRGLEPGGAEAAERDLRGIIGREPQLVEARSSLARILEAQGKPAEAELVWREALSLGSGSTVLRTNHAACLASMERWDESLVELETVLSQVPRDESARHLMLQTLVQSGRTVESRERAQRWLAEDPSSHSIQAHLGIVLAGDDRCDEAIPLLRASLEDRVPRQLTHRSLAICASTQDDTASAVSEMRQEIELFPRRVDIHLELANLYMQTRDWDEAAAEYRFVAERRPVDRAVRIAWAQAIFNSGDYALSLEVLEPVLNENPNDARALLLRANLLAKEGRFDEGKRIAERAREIHRREQAQDAVMPGQEGSNRNGE